MRRYVQVTILLQLTILLSLNQEQLGFVFSEVCKYPLWIQIWWRLHNIVCCSQYFWGLEFHLWEGKAIFILQRAVPLTRATDAFASMASVLIQGMMLTHFESRYLTHLESRYSIGNSNLVQTCFVCTRLKNLKKPCFDPMVSSTVMYRVQYMTVSMQFVFPTRYTGWIQSGPCYA